MLIANMVLKHKLERLREHSECLRTKVAAAVVAPNGILLWMSHNGSPTCKDKGCLRADVESGEQLEHCRGLHAEQGCLVGHYIPEGSTMYVTHMPCPTCAKLIAASGIKTVFYDKSWGGSLQSISEQIFQEQGIELRRW